MNCIIEDFFNRQIEDAAKRAKALKQEHNDLVDLLRKMTKTIVPIAYSKKLSRCICLTIFGKKHKAWLISPGVYLLDDFRLVRITKDEHGDNKLKVIRLRHFDVMPAKPAKSKRNKSKPKKRELKPLVEDMLSLAEKFGISENEVSAWKVQIAEFAH